jgi:hypothetical protein
MARSLSALATVLAIGAVGTVDYAFAVDGETIITQAKALAGDVTPGDAAGFPITLSVGGSYKLGSNLIPGATHNGIIVNAPDISIDLNGFLMSGGPAGGTGNSPYGIVDNSDRLTVKNGTIGAFRTAGINAPNRPYLIIENMRIINGHGRGINASNGPFARIQNTTVATNGGDGVVCGLSCLVEDSVISGNGGDGVFLLSGTVLGNAIVSNNGFGVSAPTAPGGQITVGVGNNTVVNNGSSPFHGTIASLFPNVCSPTSC